jgi:hypothetical protein
LGRVGAPLLEASIITFGPRRTGILSDQLTDRHPRLVEAFKRFAACMRKAGFSYHDPSDVEADLLERYEAITSGGDPDPASLEGLQAEDLAELQAHEREVARVANDCEDEHIDPVSEAVDREIFGQSGD